MQLTTLKISRLRDMPHNGTFYRDRLFITDNIEDIERFKSPCRIDAVVAIVCVGGEVECSVNLKRYRLCNNMIMVNFPNDVIQVHNATALKAYAVVISEEFLNDLHIDFRHRIDFYLKARQNAICSLPRESLLKIKPMYRLLIDSISYNSPETPEIVIGLVQTFCYTVISFIGLYGSDEYGQDGSMPRNKQIFDTFMSLVRSEHSSSRSISHYASKMFITPNYLSGVVKKYTGKTASEWINEYVILEAKIMLKDTSMSVQEIAWRLNFTTQSAFGKYFKQSVGVGPRRYRSGK